MEKIRSCLVSSIWITTIIYLLFSFIAMSIYPEDWGVGVRSGFAAFVAVILFMSFIFYKTVD
jgi:sterol desaturase/sphingolipid hydroxylase (fatty acid hydroxylase superfamily)